MSKLRGTIDNFTYNNNDDDDNNNNNNNNIVMVWFDYCGLF